MISRARAWACTCKERVAVSEAVQKLGALIGNPRSSQQLMGQLPIFGCLKAKKFNDFSRAGVGVYVQGKGRRQRGFDVVGSDIIQGADFLGQAPEAGVSAIITNPPYALAPKFIERAMHFDNIRIVAMLLRTDFDHAASRAHLFADAVFAKKVVLTKRVRWFEDSVGSPSFNHCWMIWDRQHRGPPTIAYDVRSTASPAQQPSQSGSRQLPPHKAIEEEPRGFQ